MEPKRWRDDPEVLEELGLDLSAEAESLATHDLGAMEQAVHAKIAAGTAASSVVPYLIGALIVGGAATWWLTSTAPDAATRGVVVAEAPRGARGVDGTGARGADENARGANENEANENRADENEANARANENANGASANGANANGANARGANARGANENGANTRGANENAASARRANENGANANGAAARGANSNGANPRGDEGASDADADPTAATDTAAPSDLAAQLDAYERAQALLAAGDARRAIEAFGAYLAAYPDGRLRTEAKLGRLHALFAAERFAETAEVAEALAREDLAAHRRRDVHRVHGEALAMLGRCPDADAALARSGATDQDRSRIVARCRTLADSGSD